MLSVFPRKCAAEQCNPQELNYKKVVLAKLKNLQLILNN